MKLIMQNSFGLDADKLWDDSKLAELPETMLRKAASMGLQRVAGNTFICESKKDFWQIRGNKIVRLVGDEVDNGDKMPAAPADSTRNAARFLDDLLGDLTF